MMGHGGHGKHSGGKAAMRGSKSLGVKRPLDKAKAKKKKTKAASIKNQIRAVERLLRKKLPTEAQNAQEKRLEDLRKQGEEHRQAELERKMSLRYRRVKFFERRKIERRIKKLERPLETSGATDATVDEENPDCSKKLAQLKEDLEYVRFFPKTEKYVSLFMGNEDEEVIAKRAKLRAQIKARLEAAVASELDPDEMENSNDSSVGVNDDDFFLSVNESDDEENGDQFSHLKLSPGDPGNYKSENLAMPTAKLTSGKKQQFIKLHTTGSGSKGGNQRPAPRFRNKDVPVHFAIRKVKKVKEQRLKFSPYLNSLMQSKNRSLNPKPLPNKARSIGVRDSNHVVSSRKHAETFVSSSYASEDGSKEAVLQELGSSSIDAQRKRRRKHRPKKRKT